MLESSTLIVDIVSLPDPEGMGLRRSMESQLSAQMLRFHFHGEHIYLEIHFH